MQISVIVPTFNRAHILPMCLDSLLAQDYDKDNFEIIIVDNNSKDNTAEVVENYIKNHSDISIRYVLETRPGLVFARHTGADNAKYEILSFTDDDGILSPIWLKEIANVFKMDSKIAAVAGKITIKWNQKPPDWVIPYEHLLGKLDYGDKVLIKKGLYINGGNFNIKKEVLNRVGGFNPDQVGDWLIGDGESGLCRKLHKANCLIGWAPKALMEHYQLVEKNATVADIERRYINNGRSVPFRIFAIEGGGIVELFDNLGKVFIKLEKIENKLQKAKVSEKTYKVIFEKAYYDAQIPYTYKVLTDADFRKQIIEGNNNLINNQQFYNDPVSQYEQLFHEHIRLSADNIELKNRKFLNLAKKVFKRFQKLFIKKW